MQATTPDAPEPRRRSPSLNRRWRGCRGCIVFHALADVSEEVARGLVPSVGCGAAEDFHDRESQRVARTGGRLVAVEEVLADEIRDGRCRSALWMNSRTSVAGIGLPHSPRRMSAASTVASTWPPCGGGVGSWRAVSVIAEHV